MADGSMCVSMAHWFPVPMMMRVDAKKRTSLKLDFSWQPKDVRGNRGTMNTKKERLAAVQELRLQCCKVVSVTCWGGRDVDSHWEKGLMMTVVMRQVPEIIWIDVAY
ncbi:hypothetical protein CIHG_06077 [Coccidioides immitis H538.4]|uniref:Uncharacterized protein n=1 Tax=Coccidioides immitis H538.4 TaxID=396776 RepID=A0A0J8UJP2_COCIT|nr:hypothetical protein CIHG_06077 [Coccidioides immitis H538.4]